jgi:hypothetical protein
MRVHEAPIPPGHVHTRVLAGLPYCTEHGPLAWHEEVWGAWSSFRVAEGRTQLSLIRLHSPHHA